VGRNQQRQTIRSSLGKIVRITYYRRDNNTSKDSVFNREETYEGVLSTQVFKSKDNSHFNGPVTVVGCIDGKDGKRFPILPLDGPLHDTSICGVAGYDGKHNGYWEIEVLVEE